jgi:hypothetical protein
VCEIVVGDGVVEGRYAFEEGKDVCLVGLRPRTIVSDLFEEVVFWGVLILAVPVSNEPHIDFVFPFFVLFLPFV